MLAVVLVGLLFCSAPAAFHACFASGGELAYFAAASGACFGFVFVACFSYEFDPVPFAA
jgi:hypothetical protein